MSIELIEGLPSNTLGVEAKGKITGEDYEKILIPKVEEMLKSNEKINFLYHVGEDFDGYEFKAMWDDAKVGLSHLTKWNKIALVTDVDWITKCTKVFGFIFHGHVKTFTNAQIEESKSWLAE